MGLGQSRKGPESGDESGKGTQVRREARRLGAPAYRKLGKRLVVPLFLWRGLPVSLVLRLRHLSLLGDAINIRRGLDHALRDRKRRGLAAPGSSNRNTMQTHQSTNVCFICPPPCV